MTVYGSPTISGGKKWGKVGFCGDVLVIYGKYVEMELGIIYR